MCIIDLNGLSHPVFPFSVLMSYFNPHIFFKPATLLAHALHNETTDNDFKTFVFSFITSRIYS